MPWLPAENKTPRDSTQCRDVPVAGPERGRARLRSCPGPRETQGEHPAWLPLNLPLTQVSSPPCEAGRCTGGGEWRAAQRGDPGGEQRPGPETHSQGKDVLFVPVGGGRAVQRPVLQHAEQLQQHLLCSPTRGDHRPPHGHGIAAGPELCVSGVSATVPWLGQPPGPGLATSPATAHGPSPAAPSGPAPAGSRWPSDGALRGREGAWQRALGLTCQETEGPEGPENLRLSGSPHGTGSTG